MFTTGSSRQFTLTLSLTAQVVRLDPQFFLLEEDCSVGSLSIHDGNSSEAPLLIRLCGEDIPEDVDLTSSAESLHLEFQYRVLRPGRAFRFYFEHSFRKGKPPATVWV